MGFFLPLIYGTFMQLPQPGVNVILQFIRNDMKDVKTFRTVCQRAKFRLEPIQEANFLVSNIFKKLIESYSSTTRVFTTHTTEYCKISVPVVWSRPVSLKIRPATTPVKPIMICLDSQYGGNSMVLKCKEGP